MIDCTIVFSEGGEEIKVSLPSVPRKGEFIDIMNDEHDDSFEVQNVAYCINKDNEFSRTIIHI